MIKLYFEKISNLNQADYTRGYNLLDCALKEKISAIKNEKKSRQSLLGYILLYKGAKELYNKTNFKIEFSEHGKPFCDFCHFNISHSGDIAVCAFCDRPIGVDIQKATAVKRRTKYRLFTKEEAFYVNQSEEKFIDRFFEIFTKKEAALKLYGLDISSAKNIDTFSGIFDFKTDKYGDYYISYCTLRE